MTSSALLGAYVSTRTCQMLPAMRGAGERRIPATGNGTKEWPRQPGLGHLMQGNGCCGLIHPAYGTIHAATYPNG